jgi:hypothetical protein
MKEFSRMKNNCGELKKKRKNRGEFLSGTNPWRTSTNQNSTHKNGNSCAFEQDAYTCSQASRETEIILHSPNSTSYKSRYESNREETLTFPVLGILWHVFGR